MRNRIIIPTLVFAIVLPLSASVLYQERSAAAQPSSLDPSGQEQSRSGKDAAHILLFYSDACPHCQNVEKFLEENDAASKLAYERRSVLNSPSNVLLLDEKATSCNMEANSIPFLWTDEGGKDTCLVGDKDIIAFFSNKLNP